jgi:hypothetical protein
MYQYKRKRETQFTIKEKKIVGRRSRAERGYRRERLGMIGKKE